MKKTLLLFFIILPLLLSSLTAFSLTFQFSLSGTIVTTTPQSISNHVYCLSQSIEGKVTTNGETGSINVTSFSAYISAIGLPPLPLDGVPITPPQAIGDNVYFVYIPGVTSIPNGYTLTESYLAYANYTNGSWHTKNLTTSGIVTGIFAYNNSLYALWKPSLEGVTHLLVISQNQQVIRNVSLSLVNATSIQVSGNLGVISVGALSLNLTQEVANAHRNEEYFVVNLSNGETLYQIPNYNTITPTLVSVSNGMALVSYIPNTSSSYLVLYNLSTGKVLFERSYDELAEGFINKDFILVAEEKIVGTSGTETFSVYNLSWDLLYQESKLGSESSLYYIDGLFVNSTSVTILLVHITTQINLFQFQVTLSSSLDFVNALQSPKPFTFYVSEQHYPGYTLLDISWNENQPDTYLVYINNTLIGQTKSESMEYNVTENGTYLIKIVAENVLGSLEENATLYVTVYPIQKITSSSTTTTSTTSSITNNSTTPTTSSSTTITPIATTYTFFNTNQSISTTSSATTMTTSESHTTTLITVIVVAVIIVVVLILFLIRRK